MIKQNSPNNKPIPDSSKKTARGSKSLHSEKDKSTKVGFKPKDFGSKKH